MVVFIRNKLKFWRNFELTSICYVLDEQNHQFQNLQRFIVSSDNFKSNLHPNVLMRKNNRAHGHCWSQRKSRWFWRGWSAARKFSIRPGRYFQTCSPELFDFSPEFVEIATHFNNFEHICFWNFDTKWTFRI